MVIFKDISIFTFSFVLFMGALSFCHSPGGKRSESGKKGEETEEDIYTSRRLEMVEEQIVTRGVSDSLTLKSMRKVPRHLFIPESLRKYAYYDEPLPIGEDQTISQPYIVAIMTELLQLKGGEKVLEIGTGSGYQAAILAEIAAEVYTIEIVDILCESARELLGEMGYQNIQVRCADGYQGWPEAAPFDAVIVTAAPDHIPQPLVDQLKIGGRLVLPVGDGYQELVRITRTKSGTKRENIIPVRFVPMTGEAEKH